MAEGWGNGKTAPSADAEALIARTHTAASGTASGLNTEKHEEEQPDWQLGARLSAP
jgi:hypothetical protein